MSLKFEKRRWNVRLINHIITKLYFEKLNVFIKKCKNYFYKNFQFFQTKFDVLLIVLFLLYTNLLLVVVEESSSLQDTIFCFDISLLPKLKFSKVECRGLSSAFTVCWYNLRILSVHREPIKSQISRSVYILDTTLKSDSHLSKKWCYLLHWKSKKSCYLLHWKPFKNEKCFLFHLKSSFRSQDI